MAEQYEYLMLHLYCVTQTETGLRQWQVRKLAANGTEPLMNPFLDAPSALNSFGAAGWELIATGNDGLLLILKRSKP